MNYYESQENNTTDIQDRDRVVARLREAGLSIERGVTVENGGKACYDHTCYPIPSIDGNFGVYAGDRLLLLDIDDYGDESPPDQIQNLPETFTVRSPHGGSHRYYACGKNLPRRLEETFGSANPSPSFGEVYTENQLVVGPGSELDSCDKAWHDCSRSDAGQYVTKDDHPIRRVATEEVIEGSRLRIL